MPLDWYCARTDSVRTRGVHRGLGLRAGQRLLIRANLHTAALTRVLVREAYRKEMQALAGTFSTGDGFMGLRLNVAKGVLPVQSMVDVTKVTATPAP